MAISFPRISLPESAPRPRHHTRSGGARVDFTALPCPNGAGAPMKESLPLLPTSVIGSHGLPGWLWLAREALEARRLGANDGKGVMGGATPLAPPRPERGGGAGAREARRPGATDVKEVMEDATQLALLDQERAGVAVRSTGEMGRVRFIVGFYERLTGLRHLDASRKLGAPHWDTYGPFEAVGKGGAAPGPFPLLIPLRLGSGYRDRESLLADLVAIVNRECRALVEAGADFIQIDEPNYAMYRGATPELAAVFNRAVAGVRAKIPLHVCFGNLHGRPFPAVRSYRHLFPALYDVKAEQILLEFANRGMEDAGLWKEFPTDKELGAGVIDVKAFKT